MCYLTVEPVQGKGVVIAYLDRDRLQAQRSEYFESPRIPGRLTNRPVRLRLRKIQQRYTPKDPHQDPYFMAVLIALAQEERRDREQAQAQEQQSFH